MLGKEDRSSESIFFGAQRLVGTVPKVVAGLIGLGSFAYIVGWFYARSYFSEFGASWILSDVPVLTVLGYSWLPVIIVLFFGYLGVTDLAETESKAEVKDSKRFRASISVFNHGRWVFVILALANPLVVFFGFLPLASFLSMASVFVTVAMATSAIEILVVRLSRTDLKIDLPIAYLSYAIIAFGFYVAPSQMGRNAALLDKLATSSSLPRVYLRSDEKDEYRLLFSSGERFYVFPSDHDTEFPPIRITSPADIKYIQRRIKSELKQGT